MEFLVRVRLTENFNLGSGARRDDLFAHFEVEHLQVGKFSNG